MIFEPAYSLDFRVLIPIAELAVGAIVVLPAPLVGAAALTVARVPPLALPEALRPPFVRVGNTINRDEIIVDSNRINIDVPFSFTPVRN